MAAAAIGLIAFGAFAIAGISEFVYPATAYCDGVFGEGSLPDRKKFQHKRLEKAYKRIICECDPETKASCNCETVEQKLMERQIANFVTMTLISSLNVTGKPKFTEEVDAFLNSVSDKWIVVIVDEQNIFAFKKDSTIRERRCVVRKMTEATKEIIIESNERFGEPSKDCPEKDKCCTKKSKCCTKKSKCCQRRKTRCDDYDLSFSDDSY